MHDNMFTLYNPRHTNIHSNDQTLQLIKQSGAFILGSVLTCCPSISIDLTFDRQHHHTHRFIVFFVGFCARHSFINAWDGSFLRGLFIELWSEVMQREKALCFLNFEIQSNPFQISVFDQSMFCMTLPHSLWSERFCPMLKVCTVHKLLTKSHGKWPWMEQVGFVQQYSKSWPDQDC